MSTTYAGKLCLATMMLAFLAVPAHPAAAQPARGPETPYQAAHRTAQRVELPDRRTEFNTSYANPDGSTTLAMSMQPVRIRKSGGWVAPDATVERRPDGSVGPRATLVDVSFSAGGTGPLARIREGRAQLALGAPMRLPAPVLSGATATYPAVRPGIDLVVTATVTGFSEVLVVKNRAAAADPALARLRFALSGNGLTARRDATGGVQVTDRSGTTLLAGARPVMWDSTSDAAAVAAGRVASPAGPVEGNRVVPMDLRVDAAELAVRPDAGLLTSSSTRFPVFIDPQWHQDKPSQWAMVNRTYPTSTAYKWDDTEGMGYVSTPEDGTHLKRLFFTYPTAALRVTGRKIISATFSTRETWAYTCTTARMQVWLSNGYTSSINWNNQPSTSGYPYTERNVATSGRAGCNPGGSAIDFDVTNQIIRSLLNGWSTTSLMMRATDETSSTGWRRFANKPTLEVVYNTYPDVPSSPQMISPATKCGGVVPYLDPPVLQVKATDPDKEQNQVTVEFQIWKAGASAPTYKPAHPPFAASGTTFRYQVPTLPAGNWSWIARTIDNQNPSLSSGWTGWCNFTVDNIAPTPPLVWFDGGTFTVGQTVNFHFTGGGNDVVSYRWAVNNDEPTSAAVSVFDGKAAIRVGRAGPFLLRVWAYDAAGHRGAPAVWGGGDTPILASGGDARDWWRFDEGTGTTSANQKTAGNGLVTTGGVGWTSPGFPLDTGSAMVFDGTNDQGAGLGAPGPVTGDNFTVSVWARPTDTTGKQVLISQDGSSGNASFSLSVQTIAGPKDAAGAAGPVAPRLTATLYKADGSVALAVPSRRIVEAGEWIQGTITLEYLESGDVDVHLYTVTETDPSEIDDSNAAPFGGAYGWSTASSAYVRVGGEERAYGVGNYFGGAIDEAVTAAGLFDPGQRQQWRYPPPVLPGAGA